MARTREERTKMVEILSENPSVNYACKKVGIARATHYRWMKENKEYCAAIERALLEGRNQWIEVAEAILLKKMKEGNMRALTFFLSNNDPRYVTKRSVYQDPFTPEERKELETFRREKGYRLPPEEIDAIMFALENYGIVKRPSHLPPRKPPSSRS